MRSPIMKTTGLCRICRSDPAINVTEVEFVDHLRGVLGLAPIKRKTFVAAAQQRARDRAAS